MYDLARVKEEFNEVCDAAGCPCTVPIEINSRLSTTLGRVDSLNTGGYVTPLKVMFSKSLITTATDEDIRQIVLHEAAHYIAIMRTHEHHGHDSYFKDICAEIGCTNDGATYMTEAIKADDKLMRYSIYCPNCGYIKGQGRFTSLLRNLSQFECSKCGSDELSYIKNW